MTKESHKKRTVLISGASGGIGTAASIELMSDYQLSLGSRSGFEDARIRKGVSEGEIHSAQFDASIEEHANAWVTSAFNAFGQIDALVNCIGVSSVYRFTDESFEALDQMLNVNLKAPIRLIREAYPHLLKSPNPKVINIVSLSGLRVKSQDATGYAISKFGLRAVGQAVRQAGWDQKLRVTSIFPGWVNTKMAAGRAPVPDEEMTQPEDIAKLIRLLLELPPTCSMSEIAINCLFEPQT